MRYEDASHTGFTQGSEPDARNDADAIPAGARSPATGNVITGEGTQTGPSGSDAAVGAHITTIAGAGGQDSSFAGGKLAVSGEHGRLSIDAEGNYSYVAKANAPENSRDLFTYTLADNQGNSDTATLTVEIGKTPAVIKANAQQIVPGPDGVVVLPAGVELSDIHIVGRNLVIDLPDGSQMVIIDGAVFVPQLVLGGVEVPATNLAALLIGQEIAPAAGETGSNQSSGGNFEVPVGPLDPGVPLGDLIPPTEYTYTPPEVREVFDIIDREPEIFIQPDGQPASVAAVDSVDEAGLPTRNEGEPEGSGEEAAAGANGDPSEATSGNIIYDSPDGVASIVITGFGGDQLVITGPAQVGQTVDGQYGTLTITSVVNGQIGYIYTLDDNTSGNATQDDFSVVLTDSDGDVASATLTIDIVDDVPTARPDTDVVPAEQFGPVTGNVITDNDAGDAGDSDNGRDTVGADDAELTAVSGFGATETTEGGWIVQGQYGVLTINDDGSYSYLRNEGTPGGVTDVFNYTLTDGDGDTSATTLTITIEDATPRLATPAAAQLDDDTFTGGNPGGTGDVNPDTANLSGNLAGAGGDGDLDYAFTGTNTLPAGFSIDPTSTATSLKIAQGGVVVLTITLDLETGAYTVVQNAPIDHPAGSDENDLAFLVGVKVVDADGDSAVSSLTINVDDDTPLAYNDSDTIPGGGTSATGNVITGSGTNEGTENADSPGADGFDAITALSGAGGSDSDATGGFSVTGTYGSLQMDASGNYTYTRNEGSAGGVSESFVYTYRDGDGDLASATLTINIADAAPLLGTPLIAQLDDETFTGGNPGGTGDVDPDTANLTGNLAGSGGDGDLDYAFTGTNTLPAGFSIDPTSTASTLYIAQAGVGIVMTVTLDLETGAYTITQNMPMDHVAGLNENDLQFLIGVKVVDVDGDSAINTLTINVDDDTPLASPDTDTVSGGTATGNVITDAAAGDAGDSDSGADSPGADGFDTITLLSSNATANSDNNPSGGFTSVGQYGTLQMDAAGNYTYTRAEGSPGGVSEAFTYTYRDGDGDLASSTLTITIPDAAPLLGTPAPAQLDDETFTGGNPGGTGDVDPNTANLTGNLAGSGGDGDLDYAFTGTNTLPAGFSIDPTSTASTLYITQAGVGIVLTVTLDLETGAYTVVQNQPMDHVAGLDENDLQFLIGVKVVDVDGDSAINTLTINVDDDTPLAFNDTDNIAGGGNSATGNVITGVGTVEGAANADKPGADGLDAITGVSSNATANSDTNPSGGFTVVGQYGSLQMDAAGNYTYTRSDGGAGNVSESFVYTYRDGDGDLASATLTINIADAAPLLGTPAPAQLDDETFAGGNPGGTGDVDPNTANLTGNLAGSGGDGDLDYAFTGTNTLPAGFSIDPTSTASTLYIAQAGVGIVMTVTLDLETGAYTITQNMPMDHVAGLNENDLQFLIGVKVVDVDGDSAINTLTINVDDDTPLASPDTDTVSGGTATGNVITDAAAGDAGDSDSGADSPGADGFDTITLLSSNATANSDNNPSGGFTSVGQYGTLQMDAAGNYTYTRAADTPGGVSEAFTYTYRDGDGDLASSTLTITIPDALPLLGTPLVAQLDDETFTGGNPGGTGDANPNTANLTGNLAGSGGDGDLDYAFTGTNTLPTGFSIDPTSTASTLYIAQTGVGIVMTVTLNLETGAYTITQNQPMDHPTPGLSEEDLQFLIGVKVVDVDGDSAINTLTINVDDDTPTMTIESPLQVDNDATPTATGDFAVSVGADTNSDFDDLDLSNFRVSVNGVPVDPADVSITAGTENATSATYTFSFDYDTGNGGIATATGTMVFYKSGPNVGTYTVTLDEPLEGFSTLQTAQGEAFVGYQFDSTTPDNTQPAVAVTTIKSETSPGAGDGFYVQFTGFTAGNGSHETIGDGTANGWVAGDLFSEGTSLHQSWVSVSNDSNGVGGDTVNGPDAINFNLYSSDPKGDFNTNTGNLPTASAQDMFLTFDGVAAGDDFIVVLKLWEDTNGNGIIESTDAFTTKSIIVEAGDMYLFNGAGEGSVEEATVLALAGTPYEDVVADMVASGGSNNNDGLVIIESNDYNTEVGDNWSIVGAQIVNTSAGVSGTGINLDSDVGDDGGSTGTQDFNTVTDTAPMKITNIGFIAGTSTDQNATLEFDLTVTDGDGDSVLIEDVTVNIGDTSGNTLLAASTMEESSIAVEDSSSFSLLSADSQDQQLQKTAANSNTTLLAAAVAASGLAATQAAASVPDAAQFGMDVADVASGVGGHVQSLTANAGEEFRSALSLEVREAANDVAPVASSGHGSANADPSGGLDNAAAHLPEAFQSLISSIEQGSTSNSAAAGPVAPAIAMVSAEALAAAGLVDNAQKGGSVEQVLAEALGGEAPTIDSLLASIGNGGNAALAHVASPAADHVPAWDMGAAGAFVPGADMMFKMGAEMLHHDAVQPVQNG